MGIDVTDIELKTATTAGEADQSTPGRYKVYAQLTVDAAKRHGTAPARLMQLL